jgi:hypothetical protein
LFDKLSDYQLFKDYPALWSQSVCKYNKGGGNSNEEDDDIMETCKWSLGRLKEMGGY